MAARLAAGALLVAASAACGAPHALPKGPPPEYEESVPAAALSAAPSAGPAAGPPAPPPATLADAGP